MLARSFRAFPSRQPAAADLAAAGNRQKFLIYQRQGLRA